MNNQSMVENNNYGVVKENNNKVSLGTSLIIVIAIFSSLGGILMLVVSYCLILKCRLWLRKRAKTAKINPVKPEEKVQAGKDGKIKKKFQGEVNPTEDGILIDPKNQRMHDIEGTK